MSPPTVVTFGGRERGGFAIDEESAGNPAVAKLKPTLRRLLTATVAQPPVDTLDSRVWSLQRVDVPDLGDRWCFAVQGRGSDYGAAGLCQFAFGDPAWEPAALWRWCTDRTNGAGVIDPTLDPHEGQPPLDAAYRATAGELLDRLAGGDPRITVDGDPLRVATLFTRLLPLLPAEVIARYLWCTCLLTVPYSSAQQVVAGRWPAELREGDARRAERVDSWLADPNAPGALGAEAILPRRRRAQDWLLDILLSGRSLTRVPDARTVGELLDWVEVTQLPPLLEQVDALLGERAGRERLAHHPDVLTGWADRYPERARRALCDRAVASLYETLYQALSAALDGPRRLNLLCVPPAEEPFPGWHARLAELVLERFPGEKLVDLIHYLRGPGLPLAGDDALIEAEPWLVRLGLDRAEHPEFFRVSPAHIARRLTEHGRLSEPDRRDLETAANPEQLLAEVVEAAAPLSPGIAAELLLVQPDGHPAATAAPVGLLLEHTRGPRAPWLDELLTVLQSRGAAPAVLYEVLWTALRELAVEFDVLPWQLRERWGALVADDPELAPEIRLLLPPARAEPAGPQSRPTDRPAHPNAAGPRRLAEERKESWQRSGRSAALERSCSPPEAEVSGLPHRNIVLVASVVLVLAAVIICALLLLRAG